MKSASLAESVKTPQATFNNVYLIHARIFAKPARSLRSPVSH